MQEGCCAMPGRVTSCSTFKAEVKHSTAAFNIQQAFCVGQQALYSLLDRPPAPLVMGQPPLSASAEGLAEQAETGAIPNQVQPKPHLLRTVFGLGDLANLFLLTVACGGCSCRLLRHVAVWAGRVLQILPGLLPSNLHSSRPRRMSDVLCETLLCVVLQPANWMC